MNFQEIIKHLNPSLLLKSMTKIVRIINVYSNYKHEMNETIRKIPMSEKSREKVFDLITDYEIFLKNEIVNLIKGGENEEKKP